MAGAGTGLVAGAGAMAPGAMLMVPMVHPATQAGTPIAGVAPTGTRMGPASTAPTR